MNFLNAITLYWKLLKRFDCVEGTPIRTLYDVSMSLKKNKGDNVSQSKYAMIIGSIMFLMGYIGPNIA